jgi:membrane associated rhomboid family serine protease
VPGHREAEDAADRTARSGILNSPPVVVGVIAFLLLIHGLRMAAGEEWETWTIYAFALIPARLGGSEPVPVIPGSQWWSFLTYAFLHADWLHVGLNSLWLLVFGTPVARWFGAARFLALSALCAIGGAAMMVVTDWGSPIPVIGASGAVSGLMAAAIPIMYGHRRPLLPSELIRDRRALIFVVIWLVITLLTGAQGYIDDGVHIAWQAHLGGFITGLIAYTLITRRLVRA